MRKLRVAIGMIAAFLGLPVTLEAVVKRVQELRDLRVAARMAPRAQLLRQSPRTLARPPQRRFRIAPRLILEQPSNVASSRGSACVRGLRPASSTQPDGLQGWVWVPMIDKLAQEELMSNLAVSLHATEAERQAIRAPTQSTRCTTTSGPAAEPSKQRSRITFEYVLLAGVNGHRGRGTAHGKAHCRIKAEGNLIPLNAAPNPFSARPTIESTASATLSSSPDHARTVVGSVSSYIRETLVPAVLGPNHQDS